MLELYPSEEHFSSEGGAKPLYSRNELNRSTSNAIDDAKDLDLSNLNITSDEIDFDEIDDDLDRFQEDEMVKQALHRGVDLRKYGQELSLQLKEVRDVCE